ncbi:MAG: thiamine phosphate synthase [Candidatus Omnitrophica bacterium]|nr:thiamine phosphate synthase [Candidatus Omnitrophota bacterium]
MNGFYFITDSGLSVDGNAVDAAAAVCAGVRVIQYRNKGTKARLAYEEALKIKAVLKGALFLINDRIDVAQAVDADGVHLGKDDMPYEAARKILGPEKIIGITVSSVEQAKEAQDNGADYIGVGPIFQTRTKPDAGQPLGIETLKAIRKAVSIPIAAIGAITLENAQEVILAGADAVCALSAVIGKADVSTEIMKFQNIFQNCGKNV